MQHAIKNFLDHGIRNTDFLKLAVKAAAARLQGTFYMLIIQVQCPIYKFIYPESEPVLLAEDTSERQSLTRIITHYINFHVLSLINTEKVSAHK